MDPAGASVPKAKVTITNTDRNQAHTVTTNNSGIFSVPFLPVGNYSVKVEASGFKSDERTGIVLNVDDVLKVDLKMEVGAMTDTVEVKASAVQVDLTTPASATTIEGTQVRELALGTRNFAQLVSLMPGVSNQTAVDELFVGVTGASGTTTTIPFSVNGNRNSSNNWTVDGADTLDRGSNQTLGSFPSIDAISEFKVERSSYTADSGRAGGAQIAVVTRSGSSAYHGTLYEFFRNNALNANNWANNANKVTWIDRNSPQTPCSAPIIRTVTPSRRQSAGNDFGGTFSGPVLWAATIKTRTKRSSCSPKRTGASSTTPPSIPPGHAGMLQGNFIQPVCITQITSAGIVCPAGAAPVTSIPSTMFNPNSVAYIKDIFAKAGLPAGTTNTVADTTSSFFPERTLLNYREELVRIDQRFTEKFSIWGKYSHDAIPTTEPGGIFSCNLAFPGSCTTNTNSPGQQVAVHAVNLITPG